MNIRNFISVCMATALASICFGGGYSLFVGGPTPIGFIYGMAIAIVAIGFMALAIIYDMR